MDRREQEVWKAYCDALEPLADAMVRQVALATLELGVERAGELLSKAFDLVFSSTLERLLAELDRLKRAAPKPEHLQ
jgi:hypothetical protein